MGRKERKMQKEKIKENWIGRKKDLGRKKKRTRVGEGNSWQVKRMQNKYKNGRRVGIGVGSGGKGPTCVVQYSIAI